MSKNACIYTIFTLYLSLLLTPIEAVQPFVGQCPENLTAVSNFDMQSFLGRWYTYSRYPYFGQRSAECIVSDYKEEDGKYYIKANEMDSAMLTSNLRRIGLDNVSNIGKMRVVNKNRYLPEGIDTWVLDTDYDNYAIRFTCFNVENLLNFQWAAIMTRKHLPSDEVIHKAEKVIKKSGLDLTKMELVKQDACPPDI